MKNDVSDKEEYELLPHKELEELKEELKRLKEFEITPTKKMEVSIIDLNKKLDRLISIFEQASHDLRIEEGGISFREKMRPVYEKLNKVLDQNAEIASGILAIADLIKGVKEDKLPEILPPPGIPQFPNPNFPAPQKFQGPPVPPKPFPPGIQPPNNLSQQNPHNFGKPNIQQQPHPQYPQPRPGINIRQSFPVPEKKEEKKRNFGF
jgi:hypothetical protein